ncbi:uncharacterized protein [Symphalangus syndactylus]|uniref:uncharacterized protein n=1 Tax=Symphalangus syndactylus TaxID=9590 RepID=UPI0024426F33|nr:uncharacterized protein LOC129486186 [Symphalangus syndactylus]
MEVTVTHDGSLDNQPIQNTDLDIRRPRVQILPCSLSAGKLWSIYLASLSRFSLLRNEDTQAATSQNDSHPRLSKPPDRRQRSPTAQRHFLKTWGAQRQKQPIHPGAVPYAAGSQHPEPPGKTEATWFNIAFHRRGNNHRKKGLVRSGTWDPQAVSLILMGIQRRREPLVGHKGKERGTNSKGQADSRATEEMEANTFPWSEAAPQPFSLQQFLLQKHGTTSHLVLVSKARGDAIFAAIILACILEWKWPWWKWSSTPLVQAQAL